MSFKTLTPEQTLVYEKLRIDPANRIIVSLDGGGIRGILTLQLLKKIEEIAGLRLNQFCDLFAGTSTGGIIAGLLAAGHSAAEIEELYIQLVSKVFLKNGLLANRFLNPPEYDKKIYRKALKAVLGNQTLKQISLGHQVDLLITAKDISDNEETFFTAFHTPDGIRGTYQDALLRTVLESTMSAPTYFSPLERFVDGGITTYNNPALAALMEAVRYDGRGKYDFPRITLFSFGTGKTVKSIPPQDGARPAGMGAYFWLNYIMDKSSQDASSMQNDLFRANLMELDFRRYQLSLDTAAIRKLNDRSLSAIPHTNAGTLHELTDRDLADIKLDDVSKFELMKTIGEAMVDYIMAGNKFQADLNNTPTKRDELITAFENINSIRSLLTSADWIDNQASTA
jgi:uncharacterized protein